MSYTKPIPRHQDIIRLSTLVRSYPATRSEVVHTARMWNMGDEVISLLRLFPADELFDARYDLIRRTKNMSLSIREQWETPARFQPNS